MKCVVVVYIDEYHEMGGGVKIEETTMDNVKEVVDGYVKSFGIEKVSYTVYTYIAKYESYTKEVATVLWHKAVTE